MREIDPAKDQKNLQAAIQMIQKYAEDLNLPQDSGERLGTIANLKGWALAAYRLAYRRHFGVDPEKWGS